MTGTTTTGTSTPTRSCLKRRIQQAIAGNGSSLLTVASSGDAPTRKALCKTVSFDGKEHIYFADADYDRHSVPVAPKLSYEDILELKMLNVHFMCPQNKCANIVPVGILPLLPPSEGSRSPTRPHTYNNGHANFNANAYGSGNSSSNNGGSASSSPGFLPYSVGFRRPKLCPSDNNLASKLSSQNKHFVGLLDDDLASMSSVSSLTPPPSSPSDHSPTSGTIPLIATDEEGQLIFQFSSSDDPMPVSIELDQRRHGHENHLHPSLHHSDDKQAHVFNGASLRISTNEDKNAVAPPFPVPPTQSSQTSNTSGLTPSFFALPPSPSIPSTPQSSSPTQTQSETSSPFPFAPPIPTTAGLPSMCTTSSNPYTLNASKMSNESTPANIANIPNGSNAFRDSKQISIASNTSEQSTPHASPTITMPPHLLNRSVPGPNPMSSPSLDSNRPNMNPLPGPLAALQQQRQYQSQHPHPHPSSPQLSGLPSPSLIPPSPLSLNPPNLDSTTNGANSGGFFPDRKKVGAGAAVANAGNIAGVSGANISVATGFHAKRPSVGSSSPKSPKHNGVLIRPTSPVVRPLKS